MNTPRKTSPGGMLIVIVVAVLIVLIVLTVRAEHGDDTKPEPAEATPTVTTPNDAVAVHKPYAVTVDLPDGRTTVCVFNNAGAMSCEWPEPVAPAEAPAP